MIYGKYNAINYNKQKTQKPLQMLFPFFKNSNNIPKNNHNNISNINNNNTYVNIKDNHNKKNNYLFSNNNSKTTKNSPRNNLYYYNHIYNHKYKNNNNIQHIKYETNINSPRKSLLKKVNFKTKKLNLNVKTLNMNLAINKYNNNISDNEDFDIKDNNKRNVSAINSVKNNNIDNSFLFQDNIKRTDITKIQVTNLRNQLNKILSAKNRSNSSTKKDVNNIRIREKNEEGDNSIVSNEISFMDDNHTLTEINKNNEKRNKCILLKNKKIRKNSYINRKERKKRNELNIKLFNSLKNNFIQIKLPNKKMLRNDTIENNSKNKLRNRNQRNTELRASRTQIEEKERDSSSIIKLPKKIKKTKVETNNIEYEFNKKIDNSSNLNKIYSPNTIYNKNDENYLINDDYNTIFDNSQKNEINKDISKENLNTKYEELENKYEVFLQSYKTLKNDNLHLTQENKSLKQKISIITEENAFLNNYIISIKKIVSTIIKTYSEQIYNLSQIVKKIEVNSKSQSQNILIKIKNAIDKYSSQELNKNKRINLITTQLIQENKILRKILIMQKPDKNNFLKENQILLDKDHKLNFNYDFLKNLNKIDSDFEKKLYLNISFNNNINKNNSVKKKNRKEKHFEKDTNDSNENNYDKNNKILEKKKIKYTKSKK